MANTTNFNWATPDDTDLVKDGAAAIRTLGSSIDTSFVDLKGGTTGQVLSKATNTDLDYTWITPNVGDITEVQAGVGISVASGTGPIPVITNSSTDLITTAGDLLYGTAADTVARLGIGTAGQVLKVNSGATAPEWGASASGLTLIKQASFSAVADTGTTFDAMFSSSYFDYLIVIDHIFSSVNDTEIYLQGRIATPSTIATGYYGITTRRNFATGENNFTSDNAAQFSLGKVTNAKGGALSGFYHTSMVGNSSEAMKIHGFATDGASIGWDIFGGKIQNDQTYTGFLLKASSGNVTGRVSVYGMAK